MSNTGSRRRRAKKLLSACAALAAAAAWGVAWVSPGPSRAAQIVDLRAVSVNGNPVSDRKNVVVGAVGDVVLFDVFAQITGANGVNDERAAETWGGFVSTNGIKGDLAAVVVAPFNTANAQNGAIVDLDGDLDLDVGALGSTYPTGNRFAARAAIAGVATTTALSANTSEIRIGQLTFTVATLVGGPTQVKFEPMRNANNTPFHSGAFWYEDGAAFPNMKNPTTSAYTTSAPVTVAVPEVASAALAAAAAALGLVARRRRSV